MPLLTKLPLQSESETGSHLESIPTPNAQPDPVHASPLEGAPDSSLGHPKLPFLLLLHEADTLVFIDPSPEGPQARRPWSTPTVPHRIHSEKLLATGSTYFQRMFSFSCQARMISRQGLTNALPIGIRYVLDLTPPMLDDDALVLLAELSCPRSIREWASKKNLWGLPDSCVGGLDEMEALEASKSTASADQNEAFPDEHKHELSEEEADSINPQSKGLPLEYSPERHREGIEHILHALMGLNPTLDTPCKLWTFFGLANFFDVVTVPAISDHIISWFYELKNIRFIELHPEVAYRVACRTKSVQLCRGAFAELVGDAALLYLLRLTGFAPVSCMEKLMWSPARDVLDDTELQRIEYASQTFGEFITRCFSNIAGTKMDWLHTLAEYQKIDRHLALYPGDHHIVDPIINVLKEYLRDRIYGLLVNGRDTNRALHAEPSGMKFSDLYYRYIDSRAPDNKFILQRLIGKNFWSRLRRLKLHAEIPFRATSHCTIAGICGRSLALSGDTQATIRHVSNHELSLACRAFSQLSFERLRTRHMHEAEAFRLAGERRFLEMTINTRQMQPTADERFPRYNGPTLNPAPAPNPSPYFTAPLGQPRESVPDYIFSVFDFRKEAEAFLAAYAMELLRLPDPSASPHEVTDILSCLTYNEYQYLPLWADGNDDGTGGVFSDLIIPNVNTVDFPGLGPELHTGSVASGSSLVKVDEDDSSTIRAASHRATDSHRSDLMSVESSESTQAPVYPAQLNEAQLQQCDQFDDEGSMDFGLTTDEELDMQSDCTLANERSPPYSGSSEDIRMDNADQDSVEFEIV